MRFIRLLGAVVIFYGLSYFLHALGQLIYGMRSGGFNTQQLVVIGINVNIGVVTAVNGVGLLLSRRWSRIAWLVTVTVLLLFHNVILLLTYLGGQNLTQQMLNVLLTFFLAVISWAKLADPSIKKHFG